MLTTLRRLNASLRAAPGYTSTATVSHSLSAFFFTATAAGVAYLAAAKAGNLSAAASVSWLWGIYLVGGIATIYLSLYYRLPAVVTASIPGAVLAGQALTRITLPEAAGAYLVTGLVLLLVGVLGIGRRVMAWIPMPVILGMVAGVLTRFGLDLVRAFQVIPGSAAATVMAYFVCRAVTRRVPPILAAMVVGVISASLTGQLQWAAMPLTLGRPEWVWPVFSWPAMVELALPLALTVAVGNHGQVYGVLSRLGYNPPMDAFYTTSGIGSVLVAFTGSHGTCLVAPGTGICAAPDAGPMEGRYVAALGAGVLWIGVALAAPLLVYLTATVSTPMVDVLGGLALMPVLQQACAGAFSDDQRVGGLAAFIVTLAGFTLLGVGSPFWGLVFGAAASYLAASRLLTGKRREAQQRGGVA